MNYLVLARRLRPRFLKEVYGHDTVIQTLARALIKQTLHHAYLFTGTRGIGKTTLARILAKSMLCEQGVSDNPCGTCDPCIEIDTNQHTDVIEIDAASKTKVEDMRNLLETLQYAPVQSRFKIYIIDEVHMLSIHSFNAILKSVEEPPSHVKFIFATTDPEKIPATLLSRCLRFHLKNMPVDILQHYLKQVLEKEQLPVEDNGLYEIALMAQGSIRDALSLLEAILPLGLDKTVTAEDIRSYLGLPQRTLIIDLAQSIINVNKQKLWHILEQISQINTDYECILHELQKIFHDVLLKQVWPQLENETDNIQLQQLAQTVSPELLHSLFQGVSYALRDWSYFADKKCNFEVMCLRLLQCQSLDLFEQETNISSQLQQQQYTNIVDETQKIIGNQLHMMKVEQQLTPVVTEQKLRIVETKESFSEILPKLKLIGLTKILASYCQEVEWQDNYIQLQVPIEQAPLINNRQIENIKKALEAYLKSGNLKLKIKVNKQMKNNLPEEAVLNIKKSQELLKKMKSEPQIKTILKTGKAKLKGVFLEE